MNRFKRSAIAAVLSIFAVQAFAQWPNRAITIIVPYTAGGATDVIGRVIAKELSDQLGKPVIVDNKPGAGGNIGSKYVARAKPDGYTLLLGTTAQAIGSHLYKSPGFNMEKDFSAISTINDGPLVLMTSRRLRQQKGINNLTELVQAMKSNPGQYTYASAGYGTSSHLAAEVLSLMTGVKMLHVPYQGSAPAMNDLIGGQVDIAFDLMVVARQYIDAEKVENFGIASKARSAIVPHWKTIAEQDSVALGDFNESAWNALLAPRGTPSEIIERVNGILRSVLQEKRIQDRLKELGNTAYWLPPKETEAFIARDMRKWESVISRAKLEKM